jgi:transposase
VDTRTSRSANRNGLRYPSDLTDDEWIIVAPMIPPARHGGRKRSVDVREVLNGSFYVLWRGCLEGAAQGSAAEEHGARLS